MEFCQYEYTVARKPEGLFSLLKPLLILLYVAFAGGYFAVIYITRIIPLGALIPVTLWILVYLTWRYVKQDYKYEISGSEFTFSVILGGKRAREKARIRINEAAAILPLSEAKESLTAHAPKKIYSALPKSDEPDAYVILYHDGERRPMALTFKATGEALHLLRLYNPNVKARKTQI